MLTAELTKQLLESTSRIDQLKAENGGYDEHGIESEEDFSSEGDLSDLSDDDDVAEVSGNLDVRSQQLQQRCVDALGDNFSRVYAYIKSARDEHDDAMSDEAEDA